MQSIWKAAACAACLMAGATLGSANAETDSWTGAWVGKGVDSRTLGFDIRVVINPDGSTTIAYASEPCEGQLLANGPWTSGVRRFRERIVKGADVCIDGAELMLTVGKDGVMHYDWRGTDKGAPITATGFLRAATAPAA